MKSNKALLIGLAATATAVLAGGSAYIAYKNRKYEAQIQTQIKQNALFQKVLDFVEVDTWATLMKEYMVMKLKDEYRDLDSKIKQAIQQ